MNNKNELKEEVKTELDVANEAKEEVKKALDEKSKALTDTQGENEKLSLQNQLKQSIIEGLEKKVKVIKDEWANISAKSEDGVGILHTGKDYGQRVTERALEILTTRCAEGKYTQGRKPCNLCVANLNNKK